VANVNTQVSLQLVSNPTGATLSGNVVGVGTFQGGVADFFEISIDKPGAGYTLGATSIGGLTGAVSAPFSVVATPAWRPSRTGLSGGEVTALAIDTTSGSPATTVYAGTRSGVWKTTDGGASWSEADSGIPNTSVRQLAIDVLASPPALYCQTNYGGGFKSIDGGASWQALTGAGGGNSIALDPTTSGVVYLGELGGVSLTRDGGITFSFIQGSGLPPERIAALAVDPATPSIVYAGTTNRAVFQSTDSGLHWSALATTGLIDTSITTIAIDPSATATIYVGTPLGGVARSTNAGGSWTAVNSGLTLAGNAFLQVDALAMDPRSPATLYLAASVPGGQGLGQHRLFKTTDQGASWVEADSGLPLGTGNVGALALDPGSGVPSSILYAGLEGPGTFKTTDGGATWSPARSGMSIPAVTFVAVDPKNGQSVYATVDERVFLSTDGGATWSLPKTPPAVQFDGALVVDPVNDATLYVGTDAGIWKSTDFGQTWAPMSNGMGTPPPAAVFLAIAPRSPQTLYAGTVFAGGKFFKSTDGGSNWALSNTGLPAANILQVLVDPNDASSQTVYATADGGNGIFRSKDAGATWSAFNAGLPPQALAGIGFDSTLAANPSGNLYLSIRQGGLFVVASGATTWAPVGGIPFPMCRALAIAKDGALYVAFSGSSSTNGGGNDEGVWKSTDGGATWAPATNGLGDLDVRSLAPDPGTAGTLYAATSGGGVFKTTTGGQ
jgi:photosystem II stability/assembly factor-like uncharacterized protein